MGIPKFFRFISERWPTISQQIDGSQIPEFDNLYLDMNSILHACTHSNDGTITKLTDDQMYGAIFQYIEHLFEIIKPQQTFYMAIDGVAPRAKMNQQRARRFRTAYEAEENLKKAIKEGLEVPKDDPFDSNSITPGTLFMSKLTDNLKYFIHKKVSEDSNWANIKIILSGHEVPGEGEHKIMEYIRHMKSQKDYNSNLRHCIYGLDADLIMLGLVSHDPHFALLREEVTFGPRSKNKSTNVSDQTFFLLHVSLLREYMSLEFQELDNELNFEYDFERILDDFILIMYVIGNDFLPNLPDLFINKGAFPLLIETFKQSLRQMDGYINEGGRINLKRLSIWLKYLSQFELENFEKADVDIDWFNKRLEDISITGEKKREKLGKLIISKDEKKLVGFIKPWLMEVINLDYKTLESSISNDSSKVSINLNSQHSNDFILKNFEFLKKLCQELGLLIIHSRSKDNYLIQLDVDGINPQETDEDFNERINDTKKVFKKYQSADLFETDSFVEESKDVYNKKFMDWKDGYYKDKLGFSIYDEKEMVELTKHYIEGLQWVLFYYYKGCQSWSWYYKYHYSPRISDITIGLQYLLDHEEAIEFEMSKPFKPFEQLMAVLPARSKKLMPLIYQNLMIDPQSPIIDFYPHEVDIDMNGKTASWEAVVLLSFVDEKKLIDVLKPIEAKLTPEETKRNSFGGDIQFIHNPQFDSLYPSPLPGFFNDVEHDRCIEGVFKLPPIDNFKVGLLENAKVGKEALAGFPTLFNLPFESELILNETRVFQMGSRSESMVLKVDNIWEEYTSQQFSDKFLGEIVYTRYPYLRESKLVEIVDGEHKYEFKGKKLVTELESSEIKDFKQELTNINYDYLKTKAIQMKATKLIRVLPVNGLIRNSSGAMVKTFSKTVETYPMELMIESVINQDDRFKTRPPLPIDEEFPTNSQVIFLGAFGYGAPSLVVGYSPDNMKLNIKVSKIALGDELFIGKERQEIEKREIQYYPSFDVCKRIGVPPLFLSKLTSGYMIEDDSNKKQIKKVNVGLELKFEGRRLKVLGYTKKSGKFWQFSPLAVKLIQDYKVKFNKVFSKLMNVQGKAIPKISELGITADELKDLKQWLTEVKSSLIKVGLESESLTKFSFEAIEKKLIESVNNGTFNKFSNKDIKGVPKEAVLSPSESYQLLSNQHFELGDRVVYVQDFGKVPFLSKGTVVSIDPIGTKVQLGVIFDFPLLSGNTMNGKIKTNRGLVIESSFVLNLTNKQLIYHSKASKAKPILNQQEIMKKKLSTLQKDANLSNTHKNEILNLINSKVKPSDLKTDGDSNSNAIKQIYGQIYNNIMSEGTAPMVPGIPIPPQFTQQTNAAAPPQAAQRTEGQQDFASRGRGRGRGGRGRGSSNGRGRGGRGRGSGEK